MADGVVRRELIADGKIVCYRFESLGTEAADEWFEDITDLFEQWDDAEPLLVLLDLRAAESNLLSPEGMLRARQVSQVDQNGKSALIIDGEKPANNLMMFLEKALKSTRPREVFTTEAEAVAWLLADDELE